MLAPCPLLILLQVLLFDIEVVRDFIFTTLYDIFASQDSSRHFDHGPFAFAADYETRTGLPSPFASNTLEDEVRLKRRCALLILLQVDSGPLKKAGLDKSFLQMTQASFFGLDDRLEDPVASCMVGACAPLRRLLLIMCTGRSSHQDWHRMERGAHRSGQDGPGHATL